MKRQHTHADWTLLPRGELSKRPDIHLRADIELASSFVQFLLDGFALMFMHLPMFFLTILAAIPHALAGPTLHEGIAFLSARRTTHLRWGPVFRGGFGVIIFPFDRFAK